MSRLAGVRTLVVDATFRPLRAIAWQRAVVLDLMNRVDVLEYYDEVVNTAHDSFPLPAVIRIRKYLGYLPFKVSLTRRNVLARDAYTCQYCGVMPPPKQLTIDHVHPRSRGGKTTWENVATACGPCNRKKGDRTPSEARMPLRTRPSRPKTLPSGRDGLIREPPAEWLQYIPS